MRLQHTASPLAPAIQRRIRAFRAAAAAAATVSLAAGAHVLAGGTLPVPPIFLALLALTGFVVSLATRVRLGFPAMGALLAGGQLALHEAFTALSSPTSGQFPSSYDPPLYGTPPPLHHGMPPWPGLSSGHGITAGSESMLDGAATAAATTHVHALDSALSLAMLGCHAAATIATALLLTGGEDALWQLVAWLRPLAALPKATPLGAFCVPGVPSDPEVPAPPPWRNLRADSRRGPPAVVVLS